MCTSKLKQKQDCIIHKMSIVATRPPAARGKSTDALSETPLLTTERAQPGRRFVAAWAYDYLTCFWLSFVLAGAVEYLLKYPLTEKMPLLVVTVLIFLTRDYFFEGRGVGKNFLGLQVLDAATGRPPSLKQSIIRNFVILGPYLVYQLAVLVAYLFPIPNIEFVVMAVKYEALACGMTLLLIEGYLMHSGNGLRLADRITGTIVVRSKPSFRNPFSLPAEQHCAHETP